jgi:hypothetical protein
MNRYSDSDQSEFLDYCQDLANAYLCENAEPKPEPVYEDDMEDDGVF